MSLIKTISSQLLQNPSLTSAEAYKLNPKINKARVRSALSVARKLQTLSLENEHLLNDVRLTQFTLDKIVADRNRYAGLYDSKVNELNAANALRERNLNALKESDKIVEHQSKLIDRLTVALFVIGGAAVTLGTIVALTFLRA